MNVLHIIDSGGLYGAENVVLNLMCRQKETGLKTTLGSIGREKDGEKAIEVKAVEVGLPVKIFRMRNGPNIIGAIRINKYAQNNNFDIIHCHGYKANILSGLLPFKYGKIPYVFTLHGWTSISKFNKMWLYELFDAVMAKRANRVVVVSRAMQENYRLKLLRINPVVIYNGIKDNFEYNNYKVDYCLLNGLNDNDLKLVCIGRLSDEKGFIFLLKAVHQIKTKWKKNVQLSVFGEGPEKYNLMRLANKWGISDNVKFPGYIDNAYKLLKNFDIFVMSSLTEGMPITLLEAMRAGMPIVATAVGGIPEALEGGNCGVLVPPGSEIDLAKCIIELYENITLRDKLSKNAKKQFMQEFTVQKMEEKYRSVYLDVINNKRKIY